MRNEKINCWSTRCWTCFTTVAGVHPEKADATKKRKVYHVKGKFNGYADPTFFEIKVERSIKS